jgi:peptide/nickel transport system substrate-binding protein
MAFSTASAQPRAQPSEVVYATSVEVKVMAPWETTDGQTKAVYKHILESLLLLDENGKLVPKLATAWFVSRDGLDVSFRLRKNVTFHDGTPFNAHAVKANLDWVLDQKNAYAQRQQFAMIKEIEVMDDYTVRLRLAYPFSPILYHMQFPSASMVSPQAIREFGKEVRTHPVGTGPYRLKEWVTGRHIVLERNPKYWGAQPAIERIKVIAVPEPGATAAMLRTGEIHVAYSLAPTFVAQVRRNPHVVVEISPGNRNVYIAMNVQAKPFGNPLVRQAIAYAIDKERIVKHLLLGYALVPDSPIAPPAWGYAKVGSYPFDPAKAKQLLQQAGFPQGFQTTLWTPIRRYPMDVEAAEAVVEMLRNVGITATLVPKEYADLTSATFVPAEKATHQMFLYSWGQITGDADYGLYQMYTSESWPTKGQNRMYYANPEVDKLLAQSRAETNAVRRAELLKAAQAKIWADAPAVYIYTPSFISAHSKQLKGVTVNPSSELVMVDQASFGENW